MERIRFLLKSLVFYAVSGLILEHNVLLNREEIPPPPPKKKKRKRNELNIKLISIFLKYVIEPVIKFYKIDYIFNEYTCTTWF